MIEPTSPIDFQIDNMRETETTFRIFTTKLKLIK